MKKTSIFKLIYSTLLILSVFFVKDVKSLTPQKETILTYEDIINDNKKTGYKPNKKIIFDKNIDYNQITESGDPLFFYIIFNNRYMYYNSAFLNTGVDFSTRDKDGKTIAMRLLEKDPNSPKLLFVLENTPNVNETDMEGNSLLDYLINSSSYEPWSVLETLEKKNFDLNTKDKKTGKPFAMHFFDKNATITQAFELLNRSDLDISLTDNKGNSYFDNIIKKDSYDISKGLNILLERGLNINTKDKVTGKNVLMLLMENDPWVPITELIEKNDINIYDTDNEGKNLVDYISAKKGANLGNAIYSLYKKGININTKNTNKQNLVMIALEKNYNNTEALIDMLNDKDFDLNVVDKDNNNILDYAALIDNKYTRYQILQTLYENGLDINLQDKKGRNALLFELEKEYINKETLIKLIKDGVDTNVSDISQDGISEYIYKINQPRKADEIYSLLKPFIKHEKPYANSTIKLHEDISIEEMYNRILNNPKDKNNNDIELPILLVEISKPDISSENYAELNKLYYDIKYANSMIKRLFIAKYFYPQDTKLPKTDNFNIAINKFIEDNDEKAFIAKMNDYEFDEGLCFGCLIEDIIKNYADNIFIHNQYNSSFCKKMQNENNYNIINSNEWSDKDGNKYIFTPDISGSKIIYAYDVIKETSDNRKDNFSIDTYFQRIGKFITVDKNLYSIYNNSSNDPIYIYKFVPELQNVLPVCIMYPQINGKHLDTEY